MNKEELLELLNVLNFPKDDYYILSSGCLLLYGLREKANDLDLCISKRLFDELKEKYNISDKDKNQCGFYKILDNVEVVVNNKEILDREFKDGYPVEKLETILKFKESRNLEKDKNDIKKIKEYLASNINVRKVKYEDIESVVDINIKDWKMAYKGIIDQLTLDNLDRNAKIEKWRKHYNIGNVIVAQKEEKILGFCRYSQETETAECDCEIIALYVDYENHEHGVGRKLMEYAMNDLREKGKRNMIIWCLEKNIEARKFYEKMGGIQIKENNIFSIDDREYVEVGYKYEF